MLTLTRRAGESVLVGDNVRVTVYTVRGGQVKLCFEAPIYVKILREELLTPKEKRS